LDLFATSSQNQSTSYLTTPLNVGLVQPLFQFNSFKWDKEIQKIQYERAKKSYTEENEIIALEVVNRYFRLFLAGLNLETAISNQTYLADLASTSEKRFELGRIGETEMLQVQLSARNADTRVASLNQSIQNLTEDLRDYLGIQEEVSFELLNPGEFEEYFVDEAMALEYANANRSQVAVFDLRLKQAQRDLEEAKNFNSPALNLQANFGLTNSAKTFGNAFSGLQDQESVTMSVSIPIADWGRSKARREIAKSALELEQLQIKEDRIQFEREVAGKENATNLNIAIQEYASAEQGYYQALWELWQVHYQLRLSTLYDFKEGKPLKREVEGR